MSLNPWPMSIIGSIDHFLGVAILILLTLSIIFINYFIDLKLVPFANLELIDRANDPRPKAQSNSFAYPMPNLVFKNSLLAKKYILGEFQLIKQFFPLIHSQNLSTLTSASMELLKSSFQ